MSNTSAQHVADTLQDILSFAGNTGNVNLYMSHGGTNFGLWAGANAISLGEVTKFAAETGINVGSRGVASPLEPSSKTAGLASPYTAPASLPHLWRLQQALQLLQSSPVKPGLRFGDAYQPHITSYDYDCPVGEAGTSGQQGIGGESKFEAVRNVIAAHLVSNGLHPKLAEPPASPAIRSFGDILLTQSAQLMTNLDALTSTDCHPGGEYYQSAQQGLSPQSAGVMTGKFSRTLDGVATSEYPLSMEDYGFCFGLVLYSTQLSPEQLSQGGGLKLMAHDTAWVFLDGQLLGSVYRMAPHAIKLPSTTSKAASGQLQVLVEPMGRNNFGFQLDDYRDRKGLVSNVTLDGQVLTKWSVQNLCLDSRFISKVAWSSAHASAGQQSGDQVSWGSAVPMLYKAYFTSPIQLTQDSRQKQAGVKSGVQEQPYPADTFLHLVDWNKGLVWVNGHLLGRYWSSQGPQMSLYVPGVWLRADAPNEVVVLELKGKSRRGGLVIPTADEPDFYGPRWGPDPLY